MTPKQELNTIIIIMAVIILVFINTTCYFLNNLEVQKPTILPEVYKDVYKNEYRPDTLIGIYVNHKLYIQFNPKSQLK